MKNSPITIATVILLSLGAEIPETSSPEQSTCVITTIPVHKIKDYFQYVNSSGSVSINTIEELKNQVKEYMGLSTLVRENTLELITYFAENDIELPDISPTDEGTIIFEFSDSSLHYAIEVFESGLISYFTNKTGEYVFTNFRVMEKIKETLLNDIPTVA